MVKNDPEMRQELLPLVVDDLTHRIAVGTVEYGEPLTYPNGRDMLVDAYEEALDLCLYLKGAILELKGEAILRELKGET